MFILLGTNLFWGSSVTLRFLLISWFFVVLDIHDNATPTNLNAVVAIGILMGIAVIAFTLQSSIISSYILLIIIGALGGFFLVSLNVFIQK